MDKKIIYDGSCCKCYKYPIVGNCWVDTGKIYKHDENAAVYCSECVKSKIVQGWDRLKKVDSHGGIMHQGSYDKRPIYYQIIKLLNDNS